MNEINPEWELSVAQVKEMFDRRESFLLLNVREPDEYAICRIDGAHLVPLGELAARCEELRTLAADRPIVTQCHHGGRSLNAAILLRKLGFEGVRSMAGGINGWSIQIDPAVPRY